MSVGGKQGGLVGVVIAGCEAHVCLMQAALGLLQADFRVWVLGPACGSRFGEDHDLAMQRLRQCGAQIVFSEMVAFEWLQSKSNERFHSVLALVKARKWHCNLVMKLQTGVLQTLGAPHETSPLFYVCHIRERWTSFSGFFFNTALRRDCSSAPPWCGRSQGRLQQRLAACGFAHMVSCRR